MVGVVFRIDAWISLGDVDLNKPCLPTFVLQDVPRGRNEIAPAVIDRRAVDGRKRVYISGGETLEGLKAGPSKART